MAITYELADPTAEPYRYANYLKMPAGIELGSALDEKYNAMADPAKIDYLKMFGLNFMGGGGSPIFGSGLSDYLNSMYGSPYNKKTVETPFVQSALLPESMQRATDRSGLPQILESDLNKLPNPTDVKPTADDPYGGWFSGIKNLATGKETKVAPGTMLDVSGNLGSAGGAGSMPFLDYDGGGFDVNWNGGGAGHEAYQLGGDSAYQKRNSPYSFSSGSQNFLKNSLQKSPIAGSGEGFGGGNMTGGFEGIGNETDLRRRLLSLGMGGSDAYNGILGQSNYGTDFKDIIGNLGNPTDYSSLLDMTKGTDGVYSPSVAGSLPSKGYKFSDLYKPQGSTADNYFKDYLGAINAPSSVDAVRSSLENELLQQTYQDIDQSTNQDVARLKSDFLDRGLGGPGQISDIEGNALAQSYGAGTKAKTGARLNLSLAELERQKGRELAQTEAYGKRYDVGAREAEQGRTIAAGGATTDTQMLNELLGLEYKGGQSAQDRALQARETVAKLGSAEKTNLLNQLLNFALEREKTSTTADLTREKIASEEGIQEANRLWQQLYGKGSSSGGGDGYDDKFLNSLMSGLGTGFANFLI